MRGPGPERERLLEGRCRCCGLSGDIMERDVVRDLEGIRRGRGATTILGRHLAAGAIDHAGVVRQRVQRHQLPLCGLEVTVHTPGEGCVVMTPEQRLAVDRERLELGGFHPVVADDKSMDKPGHAAQGLVLGAFEGRAMSRAKTSSSASRAASASRSHASHATSHEPECSRSRSASICAARSSVIAEKARDMGLCEKASCTSSMAAVQLLSIFTFIVISLGWR